MSDKLNINEQVQMILDIANQLRGPFKEDEDEAERNRIKRTVLPKLDWLIE